MNHLVTILIPFGFLALAICSVWLKPIQFGKHAISVWIVLFCVAIVTGVMASFLTWLGVVEIGIFALCAYFSAHSETYRIRRIFFTSLTVLLALALSMHKLPGFHNPVLIENVKFSIDALPYTQYANFDKATAGLIILALLCRRVDQAARWSDVLRRSLPVALITTAAVIGTAMAMGLVNIELKFTGYTLIFLMTNLLFTCVAEEAFFRGYLQARLAAALSSWRAGGVIAALASAGIFGLAHVGGGALYVVLAGLGGLGYAYAYLVVKRVEAPIIVHFVLNAVHFVAFTYPAIKVVT